MKTKHIIVYIKKGKGGKLNKAEKYIKMHVFSQTTYSFQKQVILTPPVEVGTYLSIVGSCSVNSQRAVSHKFVNQRASRSIIPTAADVGTFAPKCAPDRIFRRLLLRRQAEIAKYGIVWKTKDWVSSSN